MDSGSTGLDSVSTERDNSASDDSMRLQKKLFVFDLDGTLAPSKSQLDPEMANLLVDLLNVMKVAVISGGRWQQFETQLLANLGSQANLRNLFLLPTCGTQYYYFNGQWTLLYSEEIDPADRAKIISSMKSALATSGEVVNQTWGEQVEDRLSQITLSVLGQDAPLAEKEKWDRDFSKRQKIISLLQPMIPNYAVRMGGTTSIDVTKPGIDKAYGIAKLMTELNITKAQMLFAGDAIFEGGNDFAVQQAGVDSLLVSGPEECGRVIQTVIAVMGDGRRQIVAPPKTH
jgi:phosphomannomutase